MKTRQTKSTFVRAGLITMAAVLPVTGGIVSAAPAQADAAGQSREAVITQYQQMLLPLLDVPIEWTGSTDSCAAGTTSPAFQRATIDAVNYVRGLAGQPAVSLNPNLSASAQAAALIMAAQSGLSHSPPSDWRCWSDQGYRGAGQSNLYLGRYGPKAIVGYMADPGSSNISAGHRRWILNSRGTAMGTGDTERSNALNVIEGPRGSSNGAPIPWPKAGYFPWQLEPLGRWSLGLPGADFGSASVSASVNGTPLPLTVHPIAEGYADNTITWNMTLPIDPAEKYAEHREDMNVDVTVSGIRLGDGRTIDHSYTVNLVDAAPISPPSGIYPNRAGVMRHGSTLPISWGASASDGGDTPTYIVTATPRGTKAARKYKVRTCETTELICTLTGLEPSVGYDLEFVARNSAGSSEPSTMSVDPITKTPSKPKPKPNKKS